MNQLPDSPAGLMHLMPSKAEEIKSFAAGIIRSVQDGQENPLDVMLQIRAMEKAFEEIKSKIKDNVNSEADKYPGVTFNYKGVELAKGDVHTSYDYSVCGDTVYERLKVDADAATTNLKARELFLKGLKSPLIVVDELTGEAVTIKPPLKKSTPGVKFFIR